MSRTRWRLLAIASLVGITSLMASPSIVGAEQDPNKPIVIPVDETFQAPNLTRRCGFDVWARVFGTITTKVLPTGVQIEHVRLEHVFSGPGGSQTVSQIANARFTTTTSPDGTLVDNVTISGRLMYHQIVPGTGTIDNNSGIEVFQVTYEYDEELGEYVEVDFQDLFDAGPNDELTDEDFALICEQLV